MAWIEVRESGPVRRWHIHRPDRRNGLGTVIAAELQDLLENFREECRDQGPAFSCRLLAISATAVGNGDSRTWIGGGDLKELAGLTSADEGQAYSRTMTAVCTGLQRLPVPVLMAVDGRAIGGGAEFALAGDLRLATAGSTLEFRQLQVGLSTGYGGAARLVRLVGQSRATGWILGCAVIDSATARETGLIHELVPDAAALEEAITRQGRHFAGLAPEAVAAQKELLAGRDDADDSHLFRQIWLNPSHRRFMEKYQQD